MHVGLHELLDEVDLSEGLVAARLLDVENGDDVFVIEVAEELHLTQRAQTEHGVVEGCDLLDGHLLARRLVQCRATTVSGMALVYSEATDCIPYNTVGTLAYYILNVILLRHVEGDLAGSALGSCARHDCELVGDKAVVEKCDGRGKVRVNSTWSAEECPLLHSFTHQDVTTMAVSSDGDAERGSSRSFFLWSVLFDVADWSCVCCSSCFCLSSSGLNVRKTGRSTRSRLQESSVKPWRGTKCSSPKHSPANTRLFPILLDPPIGSIRPTLMFS